MTAAERLKQLAGTTGTAAALLLAIGIGATAGDALANYSGMLTGSAEAHLLAEKQDVQTPPSATSSGIRSKESDEERTRLFREHHEYLDLVNVSVADSGGGTTNVEMPKNMPLPLPVIARAMRGNVLPDAPTVADILDDLDALFFMAVLIIESFDE